MSKKITINDINEINIKNIDMNEINKYFSDYTESIDTEPKKKEFNGVNNQSKNTNKINKCPSCLEGEIMEDYSQGNIVCKNCGQVLEGIIDFNPEWKQFDDDDKANGRCGMPINIHLPQSSLGTTIAGMGRSRIKILHGWNAMPYNERSLNNEFKTIKDACLRGGIMKCVEDDAIVLYKTANESKNIGTKKNRTVITRGLNRISINAGCVFFACSRNGVTRTSKEIANLYGINDTEMNRGCKNLLKLLKNKNVSMKMGTSKPENFIKRYCDDLKIKNIYTDEAIKIASNIEKLNIASGHTPYSSAAASILLMAEIYNLKSITKKKLAKEFNISDVTITKTYSEIQNYRDVLLNNKKTEEIVKKINIDMENETTPPEILERMKKFGLVDDSVVIVEKIDEINTTNILEKKYETIIDMLNKIDKEDISKKVSLMMETNDVLSKIKSHIISSYENMKI